MFLDPYSAKFLGNSFFLCIVRPAYTDQWHDFAKSSWIGEMVSLISNNVKL